MENRRYLCIDLKSFFASVECVERGLDPMTARLVVADPTRGAGTICLAVTPAMKALGVKNRCRVFEIPKSIDYIKAPPRMQKYLDYSAKVYGVYLSFVSRDDIHVYSVDEAFLDVTKYLPFYGMGEKELAVKIMDAIYDRLGLRATCGIGTNLYLAKIALDITAKHSPDFIGILDEKSYCETLWNHRPLTDFWRIGPGTARRLESRGMFTFGAVARMPEDVLYRMFGIDAELLIDHAWGREPVTIEDIKSYRSKSNCLSSGQVLMRDYTADEAELVVREMMDAMCLDMMEKEVVTDSVTLGIVYSWSVRDASPHGTFSVKKATNADSVLTDEAVALYRRLVDRTLPVKRIYITCNRIMPDVPAAQLSMFDDPDETAKARTIQKTMIGIKKRYGKNAILRGTSYVPAATARERNCQIGGHKA